MNEKEDGKSRTVTLRREKCMEEIIKEYAEGILSAVGGIVILGILTALVLGKNSRFVQLVVDFISSSV